MISLNPEPPPKKRRTSPGSLTPTHDAITCGLPGDHFLAVSEKAPSVGVSPIVSADLIKDHEKIMDVDMVKREMPLSSISATQADPSAPATEEDDASLGPQQYHCDACQKDISNVFRVRCGECTDFDLCVNCFASGVETGEHKNYHQYIPIGRNDFPLFTPDWNADEEVMLLEGVSKFGFGNWSEVADLVGPYNNVPKKKQACEEHYYSIHIAPYRDKPVNIQTVPVDGTKKEIIEARQKAHEKLVGENQPPAPIPIFPPPPGASCNVVGYMPLRGDFDVEYDNDAELILSDIEFRGDELPQERELKLKILDIYNAKLDERILRKRVVIEKGLADWRRVQQMERRRTREENDLHNLFRLLVRYDVPADHEEFVRLIIHERRIRERIMILQEWKSIGLKTYQEVEEYENMKLGYISGTKPNISPTFLRNQPTRLPTRRSATADSTASPASPTASTETTVSTNSFVLEAPAAQYPGAKLLSEKEVEFCDSLQIPPLYFLIIKHTLLRTMIENGDPNLLQKTKALRLDGTKQGCLYDFIIHSKFHIPTPSVPPVEVPIHLLSTTDSSLQNVSPVTARKSRARRRMACVDSPPSVSSQVETGTSSNVGGKSTATRTVPNNKLRRPNDSKGHFYEMSDIVPISEVMSKETPAKSDYVDTNNNIGEGQ